MCTCSLLHMSKLVSVSESSSEDSDLERLLAQVKRKSSQVSFSYGTFVISYKCKYILSYMVNGVIERDRLALWVMEHVEAEHVGLCFYEGILKPAMRQKQEMLVHCDVMGGRVILVALHYHSSVQR